MTYPIPLIILPTDPPPGKAALSAYQLRIALTKKKEHETVVQSILCDEKVDAERVGRAMREVDERFFGKGKGKEDCERMDGVGGEENIGDLEETEEVGYELRVTTGSDEMDKDYILIEIKAEGIIDEVLVSEEKISGANGSAKRK